MKIVIDIPEGDYRQIKEYYEKNDTVEATYSYIYHGTPLPEHHGRIIDESQISRIEFHTERELYGNKIRYVKVTDAPTIIDGSEA